MCFVIGEDIENERNNIYSFSLSDDGSLLYSDKRGSFNVSLGGSWRFQLVVDCGTGQCIKVETLLYEMFVIISSLSIPKSQAKKLYFVQNKKLEQFSGCYYYPFDCKAYYDPDRSVLCFGNPKSNGECIEFANKIFAIIEDSFLRCVFFKLDNINSNKIISLLEFE